MLLYEQYGKHWPVLFERSKAIFKNKSVFYPPLVSLIFISALTFYLFSFQDKIYPGVKVAGINLSGLTREQAQSLLSQELEKRQATVVSFSDQKKFTLADLGISHDLATTTQKAFLIGRTPYPLDNIKEHLSAWTGQINMVINLKQEEKFPQFLGDLGKETDQPAVDASLKLEQGKVVVESAKDGLILDKAFVKQQILSRLGSLENKEIVLTKLLDKPKVTDEGVLKAKEEVEKIISQNLTIKFNSSSWVVNPETAMKLISFEVDNNTQELKVNLNNQEITVFVQKIALEVNQSALDAKFGYAEGKVTAFVPEREGREVGIADTANKIETSLRSGQKIVELTVKITKPAVTVEAINNLGIKELLGRGESKFVGSGEGRVFNLSLASEKLHGVLAAPDEVFSMYKVIGDVEASTGYREAFIILDGKTQVGIGGGVCQVSTTLFRAALNSGLSVVERYPHAYRVGYYEQNSPAGVDASVYFPNSDFKFKNDTGSYLLIQRKLDLRSQSLVFEIYGKSDGRKIEITKPSVYNLIKPKPPLYNEDPALPKGVTKQIDFEAWGADAVFERKITKNAETNSQRFFTRYQPWQAVYLVGTKE